MANQEPNAAKRVNFRIKKLTDQNLELAAANNKIREDRDSLLAKFNEKRAQQEQLSTANKKLREERDSLLEKFNKVRTQQDNFKAKRDNLENIKLKLTNQNNELINSNKKLREERDNLLGMVNEKRSEQAALETASTKFDAQKKEIEARFDKEREQHKDELNKKDQTIIMMRDEAERARAEVKGYASSTSWKVTAPIRAVLNLFGRRS